MRVLIADDDVVSRRLLEVTLQRWSYEVVQATNGDEALAILDAPDAPQLAVLDWMMPGRDGPDVCRHVRRGPHGSRLYILLLTAKTRQEDIVAGLESGADDYIAKPFQRDELRARINVGRRIIELQNRLADRVQELEQALREVKTLRGLLPICSYCKRIREGEDYRQSLEAYVAEHAEAQFSHGVCPQCYERHVRPHLERL